LVAFHSGDPQGGIYVVGAEGGEPRKIARHGVSPRFSPDGAWIAYWGRTETGRAAAFIVPAAGGTPIDVRPESPHSAWPVWSPDGRHILFVSANTKAEQDYDWWVSPADLRDEPQVKAPVRTGTAAILARQGLGTMDGLFGPADWRTGSVLFTLYRHNQHEIWELPLSAETLRPLGPARQLLAGPGAGNPRAVGRADNPFLFFNSGFRLNHIWTSGTSRLNQVTNDASLLPGLHTRFSLSPDGMSLLFPSKRSGGWKIWRRDLATGREWHVTGGNTDADPLYAPGGLQFAFTREEGGRRGLYVNDGAAERKAGEDCGRPVSWTPDERGILCIGGKALWLVDAAQGGCNPLFRRRGWTVLEAALSPDGKRLAIAVDHGKHKVQGYLAPFEGARLADPADWTRITEEPFNLTFAWGPDAANLYYFHSQDGFRCLWSQRVDLTREGAPAPPRCVRHFHSYQDYPLNGSAIAVGGNRVAVLLAQHRWNIWRASVPLQ
jgi:Tol biopolymer transport system component